MVTSLVFGGVGWVGGCHQMSTFDHGCQKKKLTTETGCVGQPSAGPHLYNTPEATYLVLLDSSINFPREQFSKKNRKVLFWSFGNFRKWISAENPKRISKEGASAHTHRGSESERPCAGRQSQAPHEQGRCSRRTKRWRCSRSRRRRRRLPWSERS